MGNVKFTRGNHRNQNSAFLLSLFVILTISGFATAKSLYVIANHHTAQFDAYNIARDGTISYQTTYNLQHAGDPAGMAISACPPVGIIFVTHLFTSADAAFYPLYSALV